ncbi:hypothetical protein BB558_005867 [Smittium angustum]|uniref:RING-type E3 ubiquitin transferase n=1 Tax=Smittium angustum TaxID=133377 RepID=A0A2U1IZD0_SMIAN|nr:hypothetical protein BB558_005867 [Smittium angustum]
MPPLQNISRFTIYSIISLSVVSFRVLKEYERHKSFFPICVALVQSSFSLLALANLVIFIMISAGKIFTKVFFDSLRQTEIERLYERGWFAVTEICLALTIFKDEFDAGFVLLFGVLLFIKTFHWLMEDRIEFMEQRPVLDMRMVYRIGSLSLVLMFVDLKMMMSAISYMKVSGANMIVIFGFEYALLIVGLVMAISRFGFAIYDNFQEREWQNKTIYVFYIELAADFLKLVVYFSLFAVLLMNYGVPLHILRDIYLTLASFINKCKDLYRYRRAMQYMDEKYITLTQQQLDELRDKVCIICREEMVITPGSDDVPKKLNCGHVFHLVCLRSWLARQQSCPTCRRPVLDETPQNTQEQNQLVQLEDQQPPPTQNNENVPSSQTDNTQQQSDSIFREKSTSHKRNETQSQSSSQQQTNGDSYTTSNQTQSTTLPSSSVPNQSSTSTKIQNQDGNFNQQAPPNIPYSFISRGMLSQYRHLGTPQLIPLTGPVPADQSLTGAQESSNPSPSLFPGYFAENNHLSIRNLPKPNLEGLSESQLSSLEKSTRESIEERLRVLAYVQLQVQHLSEVLTQVNSSLPKESKQ